MKKLVGLLGILGTMGFSSVVATNPVANVSFGNGQATMEYTNSGAQTTHDYGGSAEVTVEIGLEVLESYGITSVTWSQAALPNGGMYTSGSAVGTLTIQYNTNVPGTITVKPSQGYFSRSGSGAPTSGSGSAYTTANQLSYYLRDKTNTSTTNGEAGSVSSLTLESNKNVINADGFIQYEVEAVIGADANTGGQYRDSVTIKFTPDSVATS